MTLRDLANTTFTKSREVSSADIPLIDKGTGQVLNIRLGDFIQNDTPMEDGTHPVTGIEVSIFRTVSERESYVDTARAREAIIKGITRNSLYSWEHIASVHRDRDLNDWRLMAYHLFYKLTGCPKVRIAEHLGIKRSPATVLYALQKCDDLLLYDKFFKANYEALERSVMQSLQESPATR